MILFLCGRGGSGKDTLMNAVIKKSDRKFEKVSPFTTRPKRKGENDGDDYFFVDLKAFMSLYDCGFFLEIRRYETVQGIWRYGTPKSIDDGKHDYILVGSYEQYINIKLKTMMSEIVGVYLDTPVYTCLSRMLNRSEKTEDEKIVESCRRVVSDYEDFFYVNKKEFDLILDGEMSVEDESNLVLSYLESR